MTNDTQTIAMRRIDRAVHELRSGYPVLLVADDGDAFLTISAETIGEPDNGGFDLFRDVDAALVITGVRAYRLGLTQQNTATAIPFDAVAKKPEALAQIIDPLQGKAKLNGLNPRKAKPTETEALSLGKLASLLPAVVMAKLELTDAAEWAVQNHILTVNVTDIAAYKRGLSATLELVSDANVPLKLAENARVMAFRPRYGAVEHLAICVGEPEAQDSPLVRVHSSCVTGDILGSMRCDCGEQLHEAIARVAAEGHGVVLYLNQEGRGIGIVNKLRAYRLQDAGLDTVEANEEMGFDADERQFDTAAEMLRLLGIGQLRLLSNNPDKVVQLEQHGIVVSERVSLSLPANAHNQKYLDTKEKRCGHVF